jgi:hypothetical protein
MHDLMTPIKDDELLTAEFNQRREAAFLLEDTAAHHHDIHL